MRIRITQKPIPHHGTEYTVWNQNQVIFTTDDSIEASYVATHAQKAVTA
jgi:hypothetical protein